MQTDIYRKISHFKDIANQYLLVDAEYSAFRKRISAALVDVFGYSRVIFGSVRAAKERTLSSEVMVHNMNFSFAQSFLSSSLMQDTSFYCRDDVVVLSELPNYKKRSLYKELLAENKLADFMLFYLSTQNTYNGFIIVFKDAISGRFTDDDKSIARNLGAYLGNSYTNYGSFLGLRMDNDLLITQTNYYPIGIVILKNFRDVLYANETAREYMAELGLSSRKYFSLFFTNHILPDVKYEMRSLGKKRIIRHKEFVFSMVTLNPFSEKYFKHMEEMSGFSALQNFYQEYSFSKKEQLIVTQVLLGKGNQAIADELDISINTVRVHIKNIYKKANVTSRSELLFKLNNAG